VLLRDRCSPGEFAAERLSVDRYSFTGGSFLFGGSSDGGGGLLAGGARVHWRGETPRERRLPMGSGGWPRGLARFFEMGKRQPLPADYKRAAQVAVLLGLRANLSCLTALPTGCGIAGLRIARYCVGAPCR
jgi:hypothetical protein